VIDHQVDEPILIHSQMLSDWFFGPLPVKANVASESGTVFQCLQIPNPFLVPFFQSLCHLALLQKRDPSGNHLTSHRLYPEVDLSQLSMGSYVKKDLKNSGTAPGFFKATLLHLLGLDPYRFGYEYQGLFNRLIGPTDEGKILTRLVV
jgi:hypothetical protein